MKFFLDTEFLEGVQTKWFGKTKPTIDLISIGIVAEDGREYYSISKDFNLREAWNRWQPRTGEGDRNIHDPRVYWLRENVLLPIFKELYEKYVNDCIGSIQGGQKFEFDYNKNDFTYKNLKWLINEYGQTNKEIADYVFRFVHAKVMQKWDDKISFIEEIVESAYQQGEETHEFYGYFADYDWVVFCWLWGAMNDLPTGFPYYCKDLKQIFDEEVNKMLHDDLGLTKTRSSFEKMLKNSADYPKQVNNHNALADAKWNKSFYEYLFLAKWKR